MTKDQAIITLLKKVPLTATLNDTLLGALLSSSQVKLKNYAAGELIFNEGDKPDKLFLLIKGKVRILKNTYSGRQLLLGEVSLPGDVFGEVYLFLEKNSYDMFTEAMVKTAVLEIDSRFFKDSQPLNADLSRHLQQNMLRAIASKAYFMHNRLKVLTCGSLREKIIRYIFQLPQQNNKVILPQGREAMASQLAVTRPSLSRELGRLQQEGIILILGNELTIVNINKFEEYL